MEPFPKWTPKKKQKTSPSSDHLNYGRAVEPLCEFFRTNFEAAQDRLEVLEVVITRLRHEITVMSNVQARQRQRIRGLLDQQERDTDRYNTLWEAFNNVMPRSEMEDWRMRLIAEHGRLQFRQGLFRNRTNRRLGLQDTDNDSDSSIDLLGEIELEL